MVQIFEIDFHFVRPNNVVIIPFWVGLLGKEFFLVAVFDTGRSRDARTELKDATVIALKLVSITRHIGTRSYKAHLSDEYIDKFGKAIHLAVTQPMANSCYTGIIGYGDGIALHFHVHGSELTDPKRFAILSNTPLHEENRTFRIQFDKNGNEEQRKKQKNKTY